MLRSLRPTFLPPIHSFKIPKLPFIPMSSLRCPSTVCRNASTKIQPPSTPIPSSAYIHLPFCRKRCHYCDFPIVALGSSHSNTATDDPRITNYTNLLLQEINATVTDTNTPSIPLQTIFFGGGTPSLVPPHLVSNILDKLRCKFGIAHNVEISIEMDPGTFDAHKLNELAELGVNRVSLGVQAFQEELLRACGRAHGVREVYEAIDIVTGCTGLENWSMDLISSLPHQTEAMWAESLKCAVSARPTHVSVYDLQVEQGTKFGQLYKPGEFPLPSDNQSANLYKMASETLRNAGYSHYEISSYCKSGYECKHNQTYWQNKPFFGFGLGSASYINGNRFSRPRRMNEYTEYVRKLEDGMIKHDRINCEAKDMAMDVVMLSLRTAIGLDVASFCRLFGECLAVSLCKAFEPFVESGHVVFMDEERVKVSNGSRVAFIRLSDPDGFLLSNELISIAFSVISP
ncbi:heme chaperone HemW [Dioscorea cayenensis subsp. rotundata]|uniref:Radical S-adenosyl methionine domain-containing protein 1, mitochondrial n=1 Tax=Dioscorea cayennensis subsp. rotundata TaxID=55577 RepID=A0AB40C1M0_DIOCR|nr:heme chaperone HemW [Dioscorea cayenensis subsp. rotundata]